MSAETTNVQKQARAHSGALWGIGLAVAFGVVMLLFIVGTALGPVSDDAGTSTEAQVPAAVMDAPAATPAN